MAVDGIPIKLLGKPNGFGRWFYGKDKIYALQLTVCIWVQSDALQYFMLTICLLSI